ncbi:BrnA antitoxin family protein [Planktotalea arctica]|uniref:BrnA antitoxin family protein n=1 Tax=Planktotalea arctica TaxID=1481893 RepID=UPI003218F752
MDENGDARELNQYFFASAKRGRPPMPTEQRKRRVNLMLAPDVIAALKARGSMSAQVDKILREALGL